ncbi:CDP-alcohol phosphatidyltransferase family protein [Maribacter cobaltidurans]|uniref:CDP-alcohol phosphatidyltransferase n=1 Tax=Maribacter cobaltidurans TaxID=1178778 RepID=A0A223VBZ5_9FLAO|nr:CDP-alcohol phosphatidyltransferase family protein [Maribacter cobaltidurans]ASV32750.1 CDP-alcohol phosphatidyltransferase [Maribacter cobaltidurans]GGD85182.1 CDP-alcohol phosphatidyltransferase [Maribacter cobaltidurans]
MSKLPEEHRFLDLSDYGRSVAFQLVQAIKTTSLTPIHITVAFFVSGLTAIVLLLNEYYGLAFLFLILKSILDAADGELARAKNTPSHTGRYLDSISDIILNLMLFLAIWYITDGSLLLTVISFLCLQLQGTLYNYYYVILRNRHNGDTTSRIFENKSPNALKGESQKTVNSMFKIYSLCYGTFDSIIYRLDKNAAKGKVFPNWFMTGVSSFGLGFQLLLIGLMFTLGWQQYIIPFFIGYSIMIFIFILIRQLLNR